ncbi:GNAT family N-acetyltransferase [Actinomycetes bacterium KLBMP 9759]
MEIQRVTRTNSVSSVDPLLREYVSWVFDGAQTHFGARFVDRDAEVAARHAEFRATVPSLLTGRGRLFTATIDGIAVGVAALKPVDAITAEVKRMFVRPGARGAGVGRALLERLLADARDEGFRTAQLETFTFMTAALALYRSLGFVEIASFATSETAAMGLRNQTCYLSRDLALPFSGRATGTGNRAS